MADRRRRGREVVIATAGGTLQDALAKHSTTASPRPPGSRSTAVTINPEEQWAKVKADTEGATSSGIWSMSVPTAWSADSNYT